MPTRPSTTRSAAAQAISRSVTHLTAGLAQRREAARVRRRADHHGDDGRAAPGQQRAGVQRVAAVVAGADQQDDPRAVDPAEQARRTGGPARRRHAPSACPRAARPAAPARPRAPGRRRRACPHTLCHHHRHRDASVVRQRQVPVPYAERLGRGRHATAYGQRPAGRRRRSATSTSCQTRPLGAPIALATASFAANRAAMLSSAAAALGVGEQPRLEPGGARQRRGEALDEDCVDADADDQPRPLLLDRDGLGEVARLVDVVALGRWPARRRTPAAAPS